MYIALCHQFCGGMQSIKDFDGKYSFLIGTVSE
jgi:hypothetical protein